MSEGNSAPITIVTKHLQLSNDNVDGVQLQQLQLNNSDPLSDDHGMMNRMASIAELTEIGSVTMPMDRLGTDRSKGHYVQHSGTVTATATTTFHVNMGMDEQELSRNSMNLDANIDEDAPRVVRAETATSINVSINIEGPSDDDDKNVKSENDNDNDNENENGNGKDHDDDDDDDDDGKEKRREDTTNKAESGIVIDLLRSVAQHDENTTADPQSRAEDDQEDDLNLSDESEDLSHSSNSNESMVDDDGDDMGNMDTSQIFDLGRSTDNLAASINATMGLQYDGGLSQTGTLRSRTEQTTTEQTEQTDLINRHDHGLTPAPSTQDLSKHGNSGLNIKFLNSKDSTLLGSGSGTMMTMTGNDLPLVNSDSDMNSKLASINVIKSTTNTPITFTQMSELSSSAAVNTLHAIGEHTNESTATMVSGCNIKEISISSKPASGTGRRNKNKKHDYKKRKKSIDVSVDKYDSKRYKNAAQAILTPNRRILMAKRQMINIIKVKIKIEISIKIEIKRDGKDQKSKSKKEEKHVRIPSIFDNFKNKSTTKESSIRRNSRFSHKSKKPSISLSKLRKLSIGRGGSLETTHHDVKVIQSVRTVRELLTLLDSDKSLMVGTKPISYLFKPNGRIVKKLYYHKDYQHHVNFFKIGYYLINWQQGMKNMSKLVVIIFGD